MVDAYLNKFAGIKNGNIQTSRRKNQGAEQLALKSVIMTNTGNNLENDPERQAEQKMKPGIFLISRMLQDSKLGQHKLFSVYTVQDVLVSVTHQCQPSICS